MKTQNKPVYSVLAGDSALAVYSRERLLCSFRAGLFEKGWQGRDASAPARNFTPGERKLSIKTPSNGSSVDVIAAFTAATNGPCLLNYTFTPRQDVTLNSMHVSCSFDTTLLAGGNWVVDGKTGTFPQEIGEVVLYSGPATNVAIHLPSGEDILISFKEPTPVLLQDDRKWGRTFSIRIGPQDGEGKIFSKDKSLSLSFALNTRGGMDMEIDKPLVIEAGTNWIPLKLVLDIEPGSALDFSTQGLHDPPAGKHGWVIARPDGCFVFEKSPETSRRFYGVNFCFSAQYLEHKESDILADRLMRLGYNTVRIHHYEGMLVEGQPNTLTFNSNRLDQLDYLLAALIKRGLYITTDLYVSRPVKAHEIGLDDASFQEKDQFKVLIPVLEPAFRNWKNFAAAFMNHVNPYTGRSYAREPALAFISMVNEGSFINYWGKIKNIPQWKTKWNQWLLKKYAGRDDMTKAWGAELKDNENPADGTVELPDDLNRQTARTRDVIVFLTVTERDMFLEMRRYLRDELKVKALLTNMNGWANFSTFQLARDFFDYCDDHFYIDHPSFIEKPWQLPSWCSNRSPLLDGASGGRGCGFTRLIDKPFVITEFNYSAPGRYRGVGGILTGAYAALQNWSGIWRFAYSHNRTTKMAPGHVGYFDTSTDPLGQAGDRAAICLFLRGDLQPARYAVIMDMTSNELENPPVPVPRLAPGWDWAGWLARVGTRVDKTFAPPPGTIIVPLGWKSGADSTQNAYEINESEMIALLKKNGVIPDGSRTDLSKHILINEAGGIALDGQSDTMILDTPRTAGGYAPPDKPLSTRNGVTIVVAGSPATVWVSSLDNKPIQQSKHLLVTHLTDVQNTGITYAERERQTLLKWGSLPHLVRAGSAKVEIKTDNSDKLKVYALSTSGTRLDVVSTQAKNGILTFTANVGLFASKHGAVLCYELALP